MDTKWSPQISIKHCVYAGENEDIKPWKFLKWRLRKDNQPNNIQLPNYKYYICFGGKNNLHYAEWN